MRMAHQWIEHLKRNRLRVIWFALLGRSIIYNITSKDGKIYSKTKKCLIEDNTIFSQPIIQVCYLCSKTYEPWWVDTELWEQIPKKYHDKLLCFNCYGKCLKEK